LSGGEIGILLGVGPLLSLLATPFWTGIADSRNLHRQVLVAGAIAMIILYALIPFLQSFLVILGAVVLLALLSSHVLTLEDTATMHVLGEHREQYGRIRLWGTVGWGIGAPVFGAILDAAGLPWMFWCYGILMAGNLFLLARLEFDTNSQSEGFSAGMWTLLKNPAWLLFLLAAFLGALGMSAHGSFLSLRVASLDPAALTVFGLALPASAIVGVALLVSTMSEVPVMFFSGPILPRFRNRDLILFGLGIIALRNFLYAIAADGTQIVLIQVLHGLTFAILWMAGINFVAKHAPRGIAATAQGLFNTILLGFGLAAGNLVNGFLIDLTGIQGMYAISAGLVLLGLVMVLFLNRRSEGFQL
jgi:MFS family permease